MPTRPLRYRELLQKLRPYGVEERHGGKGSERILIKPEPPGSNRGPQITIRCHGEGDEISKPVIRAVLRRFNISPDEFWK